MVNAGDQFPAGEDYLVRRVKDLERRVDQNASSIPRSFQSTIDTLNAQVAAIAAVVNAQVVPGIGSNSATGYTLSTSYATLTSFTLTAPSGYTRALVSVAVFASGTSNSTGPDRVYVQAITNGVVGTESIATTGPSLPMGSASAFQTQSLSGLTSGSTISVSVQARLAFGPGSSVFTNATASASALFLR